MPAARGSSWEPGEQPQVEGMVVDTRAKVLYAAQDDVGVWRMGADLGRTRPTLVDRVREFGVPASFDEAEEECVVDWSADAEGLTIYYGRGRRGHLLASSQGDSTGVQDSDGAAVVNLPLGRRFPARAFDPPLLVDPSMGDPRR